MARYKSKLKDKFRCEEHDERLDRNTRLHRVVRYKDSSSNYEPDTSWIPASHALEAHSVHELVSFAEKGDCEVEARVLCLTKDGLVHKKLDTQSFIESFKSNKSESIDSVGLREAFDDDFQGNAAAGNAIVGDDYIPLLGGPFNKQLYLTDYLRQHAISFHASTHDPIAKRIISMIKNFVLGKGYRIDVVGGKDKDMGEILIRAIEEANDLPELISYACIELSTYGEIMVWKLPDHLARISYKPVAGEVVPKAIIPRYRLKDPSTIWEIITIPEDPIKGVIAYQEIAPTQYQIYTDGKQPSLKFIMQQIPANQIFHFKVNTVSNEKRGRSDLFPILGYLKRLRDSVNYQIIADQKASAWAIDTTIKGSQTDLDAYAADQQSLGTIAPAGSEFIHTDAVKREYIGNQVSGRGESASFEWCMNMIAAGCGIPTSYFGMHNGGGSTRANALVGTEPVTKMLEERQLLLEKILRKIIDDALSVFNIDVQYEVTWPELITQDRTAKLKDIILIQAQEFISKERAANMIAKELGITEYSFDGEHEDIQNEKQKGELEIISDPSIDNPLTLGFAPAPGSTTGDQDKTNKPSGMSGQEKRSTKMNMGY